VVVVAALLPPGCGDADQEPGEEAASVVQTPDAGEGAGRPADEETAAALPLEDARGRTPADAFNEHIAAVGTGDPAAVWGDVRLFATRRLRDLGDGVGGRRPGV